MPKPDPQGAPIEGTEDGSLDQMVEAASVPSLATLIQRGKDQGLIKPVVGYTSQ